MGTELLEDDDVVDLRAAIGQDEFREFPAAEEAACAFAMRIPGDVGIYRMVSPAQRQCGRRGIVLAVRSNNVDGQQMPEGRYSDARSLQVTLSDGRAAMFGRHQDMAFRFLIFAVDSPRT